MKLLTAAGMRALDKEAIEGMGVPGIVLMENAGRGAAECIGRRFADLRPGPVTVLTGKGNNGGDGYVIARHLENRGWRVRTVVLDRREAIAGDAAVNLDVLLSGGSPVDFAPDEDILERTLAAQADVRLVVDALFGTGLASEVRGRYARAIEWMNATASPVAAVDIPSGIDGTTGRVLGSAVMATLTVTFAFPKIGQVIHPGAAHVGELQTVDIGMPRLLHHQVQDDLVLVDRDEASPLLPPRPPTGHKGTFGHLLVLAGSTGKSGAAAMTAEGALRIGTGLVTVAAPLSVHGVLETKLTEAMTVPLPDVDGKVSLQGQEEIGRLWEGKEALAVGPGLGQGEETSALVRWVVRECPLPLVLDADGLNALGPHPDLLARRSGPPAVLTPHPGEMARLTGSSVAEVENDRIGAAREFARRFGVVLLLKGARTVTAFPDGRIRINGSGNPGLASGGMGDVLTGIIGGLLAQGVPPQEAAALGAFLHGMAADRLLPRMGEAGMLATDLLREIPAARQALAGTAL